MKRRMLMAVFGFQTPETKSCSTLVLLAPQVFVMVSFLALLQKFPQLQLGLPDQFRSSDPNTIVFGQKEIITYYMVVYLLTPYCHHRQLLFCFTFVLFFLNPCFPSLSPTDESTILAAFHEFRPSTVLSTLHQ